MKKLREEKSAPQEAAEAPVQKAEEKVRDEAPKIVEAPALSHEEVLSHWPQVVEQAKQHIQMGNC
jgi:hypothetical protein